MYAPSSRLSRPPWEFSPSGCLRHTLVEFLCASLLIPALRGLYQKNIQLMGKWESHFQEIPRFRPPPALVWWWVVPISILGPSPWWVELSVGCSFYRNGRSTLWGDPPGVSGKWPFFFFFFCWTAKTDKPTPPPPLITSHAAPWFKQGFKSDCSPLGQTRVNIIVVACCVLSSPL